MFVRLSSAALVVGGLLGAAAVIFHRDDLSDPVNVPVHLVLYAAVMTALLGLPVLGATIASRAGSLGLVGAVVLFFGVAFEDPLHSVLTFTVIPAFAADATTRPLLDSLLAGPPPGLMGPLQILAALAILSGLILLALAIWRTAVLPRWLVAPMLGAVLFTLLGFVVPPLGAIGAGLLYLSLAALGAALWKSIAGSEP